MRPSGSATFHGVYGSKAAGYATFPGFFLFISAGDTI
jgi:hypothetical protein